MNIKKIKKSLTKKSQIKNNIQKEIIATSQCKNVLKISIICLCFRKQLNHLTTY